MLAQNPVDHLLVPALTSFLRGNAHGRTTVGFVGLADRDIEAFQRSPDGFLGRKFRPQFGPKKGNLTPASTPASPASTSLGLLYELRFQVHGAYSVDLACDIVPVCRIHQSNVSHLGSHFNHGA